MAAAPEPYDAASESTVSLPSFTERPSLDLEAPCSPRLTGEIPCNFGDSCRIDGELVGLAGHPSTGALEVNDAVQDDEGDVDAGGP